MSANRRTWAVIMAGGSGTRFWPASTADRPKQLTRIVGETTMLQQTAARVADVVDEVIVITTRALAEQTRAQLPGVPAHHVIGEPHGRDTAPCVALAAEIVQAADPGAPMVLLPADHVIEPAAVFASSLRLAFDLAEEGYLVTFGVRPEFAATGYGYLHVGAELDGRPGVRMVEDFVEKPDALTAEAYLDGGDHLWNSGIFCWRSDVVLDQLARHCSTLASTMAPTGDAWQTEGFDDALSAAYEAVDATSIDYALMEKADDVVAVVADWSWDDLGSWEAVGEHHDADEHGNVVIGNVETIDCENSAIYQLDGPMVAGIGLDGLIVVSSANGILVLPKGRGQEVKEIVERLRAGGHDDVL